jgi:hypothetical protein
MTKIDLPAAAGFMATHARLLDRRRLDLAAGTCEARAVASALAAYRNSDGGYGWALEPDLRSVESQPVGALHAFEVFAEIGPAAGAHPTELADWLASVTRPDGGLPFALAINNPAGCSPWWVRANPLESSLQITSVVAATAHRVARRDRGVRDHPWLEQATEFCWRQIRQRDRPWHAMELQFSLHFLDATVDLLPGAADELRRLGELLPASGTMPVEGGVEGEVLRPLDFAPEPGRPLRDHLPAEVIAADLDRLAGQQQPDGGWTVDFVSASPAGTLEWRGYATVRAIAVLRGNDRA